MNIFKIEKYFDNEPTLEKLLTELNVIFTRIDYYSNLFRNGILENQKETVKALSELTGIYMYLKPIFLVSVTIKENNELRYYIDKKEQISKESEKKFVSAATEREASLSVSNYRRVRNIIEAYLDSTVQGIQSCQSLLKSITKELSLPQ